MHERFLLAIFTCVFYLWLGWTQSDQMTSIICSIFGHLHFIKFAQRHKKLLILHLPLKFAKDFKISQSGTKSQNLVTLAGQDHLNCHNGLEYCHKLFCKPFRSSNRWTWAVVVAQRVDQRSAVRVLSFVILLTFNCTEINKKRKRGRKWPCILK